METRTQSLDLVLGAYTRLVVSLRGGSVVVVEDVYVRLL